MNKLQGSPIVVHNLPLREQSRIAVEILPDHHRIRLALLRTSSAALDPNDAAVVSAIAFDCDQGREIVAAIRSAIMTLEAEAGQGDG